MADEIPKPKRQPALTLCPPPSLDWSRAQAPASEDFGDIYFSVDGGLAETEAVYLKACGLPERWDAPEFKDKPFVIGELGFGTGLNFLAAWRLWCAKPRPGQRLHFVSAEKFPLSAADLTRALASWPQLAPLAETLIENWPGRVRGAHVLRLSDTVTLTLIHDDALAALEGVSMQADGWFLDGFSPARNPEMWTPQLMSRVGELSAKGARIGTFTAAGAVRTALSSAGFEVRKTEGFGRKRHRIEAIMPEGDEGDDGDENAPPPLKPTPRQKPRPVIIGAGIAGLCLAQAFARRGVSCVIVDPDDDTAASGNAAAIIKPRLDRQDSPLARFALNAYLYAVQFYQKHGAVIQSGVTHAPQTVEQIRRYAALGAASPLPAAHMLWDEDRSVMEFPKAQVISPKAARMALLRAAKDCGTRLIKGRAANIGEANIINQADGAGVILEGGEAIDGAPIIFAVGAGVRALEMFSALDLRYSRGQISWAEMKAKPPSAPPAHALTYGGYAVPIAAENLRLLGATHARLGAADPYAVTQADDVHNFDAYRAATGETALPAKQPSRAAVRVNSKTTWPVAAQLGEDIYALTGLGSRGFVFAPLMAEMIAADIMGEPRVWPRKLWQDLRAAR